MDYEFNGIKITENEHGTFVEGRMIPKPTDEELLLMAYFIRADCLSRDSCGQCVFNRNGCCDLFDTPMDWDLRNNKKSEKHCVLRDLSMNWVLRGRKGWKND